MGNARQALHLIITDLGDVAQAVDFVALQGDPDLWQLLLSLALADPHLTGAPHCTAPAPPSLCLNRAPQPAGLLTPAAAAAAAAAVPGPDRPAPDRRDPQDRACTQPMRPGRSGLQDRTGLQLLLLSGS